MTLRLLIAEDEDASRRHLVRLLGDLPGAEVVGEAATGPEALRLALDRKPPATLLNLSPVCW